MAVLLLASVVLAHAQSYTSGLVLEQAGQLSQAFEEYRLAVNKNPKDLAAFVGLVRLADGLKRDDTLVAVSRRLEKQYPDVPEYSFGLAGGLLAVLYLLAQNLVPAASPSPVPLSLLARVWRAERWRIRRGGPLPYAVAIAAGGVLTLLQGGPT